LKKTFNFDDSIVFLVQMPAHDMATKNTQIDFTTNIDGKHTVYSE